MIKKFTCIALVLTLLISSTACQGSQISSSGEVVRPDAKGVPELNIILLPDMKGWARHDFFESYKNDFEKKYGVKVNYDVLEGEDISMKLMTKLAMKNGPELILSGSSSVDPLIKSSAIVDLKGKVKNVDKMYSSFTKDEVYYVPLGIYVDPMVLRKEMLDALQIPVPDFSWTTADYYEMYDKWTAQSPRIFTQYELTLITYRYLQELHTFDYQNKKASINTKEMKNALGNIRKEIYSGKYKLNEDYSYENYYNMLFEPASQEEKEDSSKRNSNDYINQSLRNRKKEYPINMLFAKDIDLGMAGGHIVRPSCYEKNIILGSLGLVVNKNGANPELAYEFINGILSDELQMKIFEDEWFDLYPVNGAIESKIFDLEKQQHYSDESLQLKQHVLQKIKNGECELLPLRAEKDNEQYWMLVKDLLPFIFADKEYSDAELCKELQKIEDKYNIYLSE